VTGEHEEGAGGQYLFIGEEVAPLLGLDEGGDEVLPGVPPALLHQGLEVLQQPLHRLLGALPALRVARPDTHGAAHLVGPDLQLLPVLRRDAHVLADDDDRNVKGELFDELHLAPWRQAVQEPLDDLADTGAEPLHAAGGEGLVDQHAQPCVVGRVAEDEPLAQVVDEEGQLLPLPLRQLLAQGGHAVRREVLGIAQDLQDIIVTGHQPAAPARVPGDAFLLTQAAEVGVRVLNGLGSQQIVPRQHLGDLP
jgi:hypothetical protein